MNEDLLQRAVKLFFDEFVEAFRTFNGDEIARRYLSPYSALHANGSIDLLASAADIGSYFQRIVDRYYERGCRACRYKDLSVVLIGRQSVFASVTWDLLREDMSVVGSWRESYNLTLVEDRLRVFASVDHVE